MNSHFRFENGQYYTTPKTSHLLGAGDYLPPDTSNYISNVNENGNPGVSAHINHCFKKNNPECEENDKNDIYRKSGRTILVYIHWGIQKFGNLEKNCLMFFNQNVYWLIMVPKKGLIWKFFKCL